MINAAVNIASSVGHLIRSSVEALKTGIVAASFGVGGGGEKGNVMKALEASLFIACYFLGSRGVVLNY